MKKIKLHVNFFLLFGIYIANGLLNINRSSSRNKVLNHWSSGGCHQGWN